MENPEREYKERALWESHVEPLLKLATETESHDLLVEAIFFCFISFRFVSFRLF